MKYLISLIFVWSGFISASPITLEKGKGYTVPENKIWLIKNAPVAECRVCTADVYISGEVSNVEINGVTFHGNFTFSFSNKTNGEIRLYPGTKIRLGDSRRVLIINEQNY